MTKLIKECEGQWMVWNKETNAVAYIHTTDEMFMGNHKKRYTVSFGGKDIARIVPTFQEARSIATKAVKA